MAASQTAQGLSRFQPVTPEAGAGERLPSQTSDEIEARNTLRLVHADIGDAIDDLDPDEEKKPRYLRGEFGANLLDSDSENGAPDSVPESMRRIIAAELKRGIQADLDSRKDWEQMAKRAIQFLGIVYEEATGEPSASEGSISRYWSTIMLEATLGFWANAYAEFLPADGPVKIRDDQPAAAGLGHNGGPAIDGAAEPPEAEPPVDRAALAEAFEHDYNHYLLVGDKQYYRDFSRMLWSLGPIGTEFRKVYYNPLRKLPVSEWTKSTNLIVSNEAADISTALRVTERIPNFLQADVKRLQWQGWWLDVPLGDPSSDPTSFEKKVAEVEGIRLGFDLPADHPHEVYECYTVRDLEGFEHTENGKETGLPLPYKFTIIDKDGSNELVEIRRNWKEGDEDFRPRQRYVMFGLVPGFGLYYLGFCHLLGNTERAATALTREIIDVGMMSIFPAFLAQRGALPKGTTQIRVGPMGVVEVDTEMKKSVHDAIESVPTKQLDPNVLALLQKLEQNGRNVSGKLELPQGEGTQNIPVGTMIAIVEQGTKVMMAVHKGLHASRAEELELLRELIAEDPDVLTRHAKSRKGRKWAAEEFQDMDLVPSSDPNTPSHVHRLMRGIGLAQLSQMFPEIANREHIYEGLLRMIQVQDPNYYVLPQGERSQQPNPQMVQAQIKQGIAQLQAQIKQMEIASRERTQLADIASDQTMAQINQQTEKIKAAGQLQAGLLRQHDSAAEQQQEHAHDLAMQGRDQAHEAYQAQHDRTHEHVQNIQDRAHERDLAAMKPPKREF